MTTLYQNLTDGSSYMTQHSDDPQSEGEAIYNAILATANILEGTDRDDTEQHDPEVIEKVIGYFGHPGLDSEPFDPQKAAAHIEESRRKGIAAFEGGAGATSQVARGRGPCLTH